MITRNSYSDGKVLLRFNLIKVLSLSSLGPFQIYSLLYLSSSETGKLELGSIMMLSILIGIFSGPKIGSLMDRYHRKTILNTNVLLWISISISGSIIWNSDAKLVHLIIPVIFVIIDLTEGIFFSILRSIQQTIITDKKYGLSNSIAEISGQLPTVIGASIAIPVLSLLGPRFSLIIQVPFIIISMMFLRGLRENFSPAKTGDTLSERREGSLTFVRKNFSIVFFFYLLNFTFIVTTLGNFLKPIFIVNVLHGNATGISFSEITYSALGISTGAILSVLGMKFSLKHVYLFMLIFTLGCFLIPSSTSFAMYIGFQSTHGIGNPGNRISRNTLIMNGISGEYSGRFYAGIELFSNITRLVLLLVFTVSIEFVGPSVLITISGIIMLIAMSLSMILYRFNLKLKRFMMSLGV